MQKAVVMQMVVYIRYKDGKRHAAPQLLEISLGISAVLANDVRDLCICMLVGVSRR